jgi:hypothetical protein
VRRDENRMWVRAMPRGRYGTDATTFGTGCTCGTAVGRWRLSGSGRTGTGTGTSIRGLGTGVVNWRVV